MTALLLALVLTAPCNAPGIDQLTDEQQVTACDFAAIRTTDATVADLSKIYEREGFERARERNSGALQAMFAQARAWVMSLFETRGAETYSNITRIAVLIAAIALAILVIFRARSRRRLKATPVVNEAIELKLDDPATHRARAEALIEKDPREAMREALFSLLATLERQRLARPDRTRTNRELGAELPTNGAPPELVARVTPLFTWFDRTFYSLAAVAPDEARRFLADVNLVTSA